MGGWSRRRIGARSLWAAALALVLVGSATGLGLAGMAGDEPAQQRRQYRRMALETQRYTWRTLAYAGGAADCASAPYVTYRRDTQYAAISDHWYVALQVRADAALVQLGEERFRCHVEKTARWMEMLWDPGHGGFAPRADLDGKNPTVQDVYADDNGVIGLAFLDAARTTRDPSVRASALDAAERAAGYMRDSGLWDETFGGGLWWNNQREAAGEGKPAQTTALLAHLMAELYAETGQALYRERALAAIGWLDATLWDPHDELYAYAINHPPGDPASAEVDPRYFGYDQAIVIQALLRLYRSGLGDDYLVKAQRIGRATDRTFWHPELGGYTLQAGVRDLYAPYAAWISEALLDLYAADGDPFWRDRARANLEALDRTFGAPQPGAYFRMAFPCVNERVALCRPGEIWGFDRNVYTMSQALMQRAAALQAQAY
jgi:hypothetical protein